MRNLHELDRWRLTDPKTLAFTGGWAGDDAHGAFAIPSPIDKATMVVVAAADQGWDHVSVSRKNRVPNWAEMEYVAGLCFLPDEVAMQLHLPRDQHINVHPFVLHWWRSHDQPIPLPPHRFV